MKAIRLPSEFSQGLNDEKNLIKKEEIKKEEKGELLNNIELIKEIKKDNYKKLYSKRKYCDFKVRENGNWKIGLITEVNEDLLVVEDTDNYYNQQYQIKIDDSGLLSYFRKYTEMSEKNFYQQRDKKESLLLKLNNLEEVIKSNYLFKSDNAWEIYYFLHSKIYFGLDSAMKVNETYYKYENEENEGCEESFRIILCILYFLSKYFKYLLDNKDDFMNYLNNKDNNEFIDLKIVDKKCAFFSFFEESLNLLDKIFANTLEYLYWFKVFEKQLKKFIPSIIDEKIKPNPEFYPLYKEEKEEEEDEEKEEENGEEKGEEKKEEKEEKKKENEKGGKNEEKDITNKIEKEKDGTKKKENQILLDRICLKWAYKFGTTYTTEKTKIKSSFLAYFIDYFNAYNGFSYLYQLCYCDDSIKFNFLQKILSALSSAKAITKNYANILKEEKKKLKKFFYSLIDNLNEKTIQDYNFKSFKFLINKIPSLVSNDNDEERKIFEEIYLGYTLKTLLISKISDRGRRD